MVLVVAAAFFFPHIDRWKCESSLWLFLHRIRIVGIWNERRRRRSKWRNVKADHDNKPRVAFVSILFLIYGGRVEAPLLYQQSIFISTEYQIIIGITINLKSIFQLRHSGTNRWLLPGLVASSKWLCSRFDMSNLLCQSHWNILNSFLQRGKYRVTNTL